MNPQWVAANGTVLFKTTWFFSETKTNSVTKPSRPVEIQWSWLYNVKLCNLIFCPKINDESSPDAIGYETHCRVGPLRGCGQGNAVSSDGEGSESGMREIGGNFVPGRRLWGPQIPAAPQRVGCNFTFMQKVLSPQRPVSLSSHCDLLTSSSSQYLQLYFTASSFLWSPSVNGTSTLFWWEFYFIRRVTGSWHNSSLFTKESPAEGNETR